MDLSWLETNLAGLWLFIWWFTSILLTILIQKHFSIFIRSKFHFKINLKPIFPQIKMQFQENRRKISLISMKILLKNYYFSIKLSNFVWWHANDAFDFSHHKYFEHFSSLIFKYTITFYWKAKMMNEKWFFALFLPSKHQ